MSAGPRPLVFLGPTLPHAEAAAILAAEYRPPVKRGDLEGIKGGAVVAIIDGVFDQDLAVSPSEVRAAVARGVRVYGASSMGALRAAEVPGVVGVGRVYEMYARGVIDRDDEVAVAFDPDSLRAHCVALVNVRHALDRLAGPGTITRQLAALILRAARKLPYWERNYPSILAAAGLGHRIEARQLAQMLARHDLKRDDAVSLLEHLRAVPPVSRHIRAKRQVGRSPTASAPPLAADATIHLWEFGAPLQLRELVVFLAATGALPAVARSVLVRMGPAATRVELAPAHREIARRRLLARTARAWNWVTEEEVDVSLADLGVTHDALEAGLAARVEVEQRAMALLRAGDTGFLDALRIELFLDDLALKREAARAMSLRWLAERTRGGEPAPEERAAAMDRLCLALDVRDERGARAWLAAWGITAPELDAYLDRLARARRPGPIPPARRALPRRLALVEQRCPKTRGSRRFCVSLPRATNISRRLAATVGVTRVAMITGLGTLGIPNAQAFRPDGEWSSTIGSGKSESAAGARVGAVMEEVEKWAQERYSRARAPRDQRVVSYEALCGRERDVVDPLTLDLPYDSCYRPGLPIAWRRCNDLLGGRRVWVPAAALVHHRIADDIYFSPRGARKTVTTNGLASGLTMAEAVTHALCEVVERHARTGAAVVDGNPGAPSPPPRTWLDLETAPRSTRRLARKVTAAGHRLRVWELTGDIRIPTFAATILIDDRFADGQLFGDGWRRAGGWACHPDPETAINMAILEASQTVMTHIAGAREDLTLNARSLGRHERTDAIRHAAHHAELDASAPRRAFSELTGFAGDDATADVRWILERLRDAGCAHALVADYSTAAIRPARAVRVLIPGLDTINPFHTGAVPRRALLADVL